MLRAATTLTSLSRAAGASAAPLLTALSRSFSLPSPGGCRRYDLRSLSVATNSPEISFRILHRCHLRLTL